MFTPDKFRTRILSGFDVQAQQLESYVRQAAADKIGLQITGTGSKRFLTPGSSGGLLDITEYQGVVSYYPDELVITVRAGTRLADLEKLLASHGQMLPFEPPQFRDGGTIGGAVATGLAGPGSPWRGGVRDAVLGVEMINGLGERLRFGGQVIKNVAGFDVSRLVTGSFGQLGVLLKMSLKLIPVPEAEASVVVAAKNIVQLRDLLSQAFPITATLMHDENCYLRLSGERSAIDWSIARLKAGRVKNDGLWQSVRDHEHPFFKSQGDLWRLSMPANTEIDPNKNWLIERGGQVRWMFSDESPNTICDYAKKIGATAIGYSSQVVGHTSSPPQAYDQLLSKVRSAFDPYGLFSRKGLKVTG